MSTTNLFVELIVIGVGAATWVVLLVLALFGYAWVPVDRLFSPPAAIPLLAVVYVLGIISDRIADVVFQWRWNDDLLDLHYSDRADYFSDRRRILTQSERFSELLEYGRSRLRICRGWAFNSVLIAVALNAFLWSIKGEQGFAWAVSIAGSVSMLVFALAAWFAWRKLVMNEYRKIREQAEYLEQLSGSE